MSDADELVHSGNVKVPVHEIRGILIVLSISCLRESPPAKVPWKASSLCCWLVYHGLCSKSVGVSCSIFPNVQVGIFPRVVSGKNRARWKFKLVRFLELENRVGRN